MEQILNKILLTRNVYDPLVIELNKNQYWNNNYQLLCNAGVKIDENYFIASEPFQNPKTPQSHWKIKTIHKKVKHTEYRLI